MGKKLFPLDGQTLRHFLVHLKKFALSKECGRTAVLLFIALILLLLGINGLNVVNSFVGRDFMTAIEDRNRAEFARQALLYVGVFALTTLTSVLSRFCEERLGLLWRQWSTKRCILRYGNQRVYYRLRTDPEIGNPDQRIAEDIRTYTTTTLSFLLMVLNSSITIVAFSGVLWSISPQLFFVSLAYAAAGTLVTFLLGRPLVRLNFNQLDKEADFRSVLTYLKTNAESVALTRREDGLIQLAMKNLDAVAQNMRSIIAVNRTVNYCTTGYNWLIQIIPALIIAPLFISGKVQFGVITQSAIAFTQLLGAFSLIVTQFQSISNYTAITVRLSTMINASDRERETEASEGAAPRDDSRVAYENVTVLAPGNRRVLLKNFSLEMPKGRNMIICSSDESARSALFHATAGLRPIESGVIVRPMLHRILFLGESPYLPPGTIRELLMGPLQEYQGIQEETDGGNYFSEPSMTEALERLNIQRLLKEQGGFDTRHHWENVLPLAEQQLLAVARVLLVKPAFVFMDRPSATLSAELLDSVLGLFKQEGITFVTFESRGGNLSHYAALIDVLQEGAWTCRAVANGEILDRDPPN